MEILLFLIIISSATLLFLFFIKISSSRKWLAILGITFLVTILLVVLPVISDEKIEADERPAFQRIQKQNNFDVIKIKKSVLIDAPVIPQFPELPRGCEVTSLAMLLQSAGVEADKMNLAEEVVKDPTPHTIKNGQIHFGNPHKGFVGNMYTFSKPGYGVYHEPILKLAENYLPNKMINLSGQSFEELKIPLSDGRPVWVIINIEYRELEESYFQTWQTDEGEIKITRKEHSVLITGYDEEYIYFNDPYTAQKNKKAPIKDFEKSWVQMGSQALTYK